MAKNPCNKKLTGQRVKVFRINIFGFGISQFLYFNGLFALC
jgi:hypothetical protein